jgi:hypothetical protein
MTPGENAEELRRLKNAGIYEDEWGKDNSRENVEAVFEAWGRYGN